MSMTDPIADLLTRIRNAQQARHYLVRCPASKLKVNILDILKTEGYITDFERFAEKPQDVLQITLKYGPEGHGAIGGIQRESKPGRRVYVRAKDVPSVRNGLGVAIVSTSNGLLTDHAARKAHVGGEILCSIW